MGANWTGGVCFGCTVGVLLGTVHAGSCGYHTRVDEVRGAGRECASATCPHPAEGLQQSHAKAQPSVLNLCFHAPCRAAGGAMTLFGALNSAPVVSGPIAFPDPEPVGTVTVNRQRCAVQMPACNAQQSGRDGAVSGAVGNCQPPALCSTTASLGHSACVPINESRAGSATGIRGQGRVGVGDCRLNGCR